MAKRMAFAVFCWDNHARSAFVGIRKMKPSRVTMADVAKCAGVSPATVARVIYSNGYVASDKLAIVQAAIDRSGYRPNITARALRTSKSFTMGLVVSENARNPFFTHIAHAVQTEALRHGYTMLTLNNNASDRAEREGVQRFMDQRVDAIVFCAPLNPANVRLVAGAGIPFVQVEREIASLGRRVLVSSSAGFSEAATHLKSLGHEVVAFIGARPGIDRSEKPPRFSVEALRLNGFRRAMRAAGLRIEKEVLLDRYYSDERAPLGGSTAMLTLLRPVCRATAVVCGSDILAAGALQTLKNNALRVPEDISIVGFDDSIGELLTPPLTTIAQPTVQLGVAAIRLALEGIDGRGPADRLITLPTRLVIRESTARPGLLNTKALRAAARR